MKQEDHSFEFAVKAVEEGRLADAIKILQRLTESNPSHGPAISLFGSIAFRLRDLGRAERLLRKALQLQQESPELLEELGRVYIEQQETAQAVKCFERSIQRYPDYVHAYVNLAFAFSELGDESNSQATYENGIKRFPQHLELWENLANFHREAGRLKQSLRYYDSIETLFGLTPQNQEARAIAYLQDRQWDRGWHDYEARLHFDSHKRITLSSTFPAWTGQPIHDKHILVICEQGIGDEVMFASCFNDIIRVAGKCSIACSRRLTSVFQRSFSDADFVPVDPDERLIDVSRIDKPIDCIVYAGSLPKYFRRTDDDFPRQPYILGNSATISSYREVAGRPRIGVSWWGGSLVSQMQLRSIPFEIFSGLFSLQGIDFVNLQHGHCDEQTVREKLTPYANLKTYTDINPYVNVDAWVDLVRSLDLVVTVDNSNAHFAGALGVPTLLLLPAKPNWRWPKAATHSNWYSNVEFVRFDTKASWQGTIDRVLEKLRIKSHGPKLH